MPVSLSLFVCENHNRPLLVKTHKHKIFVKPKSEIWANWRLVRLRNPIFNDGVWFDDPPRGWDFCVECHHHRPPRSHHCAVCDVCILKRNHHCYFTGACIGLGNQRHFLCFLAWTSIAIIWALGQIAPLLTVVSVFLVMNYYFILTLCSFS